MLALGFLRYGRCLVDSVRGVAKTSLDTSYHLLQLSVLIPMAGFSMLDHQEPRFLLPLLPCLLLLTTEQVTPDLPTPCHICPGSQPQSLPAPVEPSLHLRRAILGVAAPGGAAPRPARHHWSPPPSLSHGAPRLRLRYDGAKVILQPTSLPAHLLTRLPMMVAPPGSSPAYARETATDYRFYDWIDRDFGLEDVHAKLEGLACGRRQQWQVDVCGSRVREKRPLGDSGREQEQRPGPSQVHLVLPRYLETHLRALDTGGVYSLEQVWYLTSWRHDHVCRFGVTTQVYLWMLSSGTDFPDIILDHTVHSGNPQVRGRYLDSSNHLSQSSLVLGALGDLWTGLGDLLWTRGLEEGEAGEGSQWRDMLTLALYNVTTTQGARCG